jgi:NitT/TauT family transport system permease protein
MNRHLVRPAEPAAAPPRPVDPPAAPTDTGLSLGRSALELWPVVVAFTVFVAVWKVAAVVAGLGFILPAPEVVGARFVAAWADGTLEPHAWTTLVEVVLGFVAGATAGLVVGYVIARSRLAERLVSPYLVAAQAVPILALAPLLALWFGPGLLAKVVICGLIVFFPVAIATMVGIRSVDRGLLELAASLRATRRQIATTIEIPAALPSIMGGLRVGATLAVVGAIVGEWAGADKGLGVLVNLARGSLFDYPLLFATLITIALLGIACYGLVVLVERRLVGLR